MDENSNGADYTWELEYIVQLITALEYILTVLEDHPVLYPSFMADVICLVHGRRCEMEDKEVFINGLELQVAELYDTMEALELEVQFELEGEADEQEEVDL